MFSDPDWTQSRPESKISVDSKDPIWANVIAEIAETGRGKFPFTYGSTIPLGRQVAQESEMNSFFIFSPSIFPEREAYVDFGGGYKVSINGIYPMYEEEVDVLHKIGLKRFWHHPNFDVFCEER